MQRPLSTLAAAAVAGVVSFNACAEDAPAVTANLSLTSNYKFRGQDQGNKPATFKPAIQGGFDYSNSGFYVGNWNSSIGNLDKTNIEIDLYGGYKGEAAPGLAYDVGILQYYYPGTASANTTEIYGALSYSVLSLKYSHVVSGKYFGFEDGQNTGYIDLGANYPVIDSLTLNAHVGYTRLAGGVKDADGKDLPNYFDYKLGATYDLGAGFSVAGALVGANKRSDYGDVNKSRFIVTLTKTM